MMVPDGMRVLGPGGSGHAQILGGDALRFVAALTRQFRPAVEQRLRAREVLQADYDAGRLPHFLDESRAIRESHWTVAPLPQDLRDRRVEITGPVDRKMIINALNSGANVFMADFEDSNSPTWDNVVLGQLHLRDAVTRAIRVDDAARGKTYALNDQVATLMVRPRGWHLLEKHVLVDDKPVPAALFDFGLFFFCNAKALLERGSGPYFYLPKIQSHLEARLWNDVFAYAQDCLGIPHGSIKATVLIETLPAVFELHEILWELRDHSAGLNCGRWDYIFSTIKTTCRDPRRVLPDRSQVTMTQPCMRAYTQLVIQTCHRRNAQAMGGMAAQIPIKDDPARNEAALDKVRADKLREVQDGHDGTWVAHPGLVPLAKAVFDRHMPGPNQLHVKRDDLNVTEAQLLAAPKGTRTEAGLRQNLDVGVRYLAAWLSGNGCVPLYNLMEDAATAEISRTQVWQWLTHRAMLDDGRAVTEALVRELLAEELDKIRAEVGDARFQTGRFDLARKLFEELAFAPTLAPFLTLRAYDELVTLS